MFASETPLKIGSRMNAWLKSSFTYGREVRRDLNGRSGDEVSLIPGIERQINYRLTGYPRNHNYQIRHRRLIPSFRLYERLRPVRALVHLKDKTFLDIGCCRGYYVFDAASRPSCRRAVGIDVHEPFLSTAAAVKDYLNIEKAVFRFAGLKDVADKPGDYGGPFQTVSLLGAYHYLYWGSAICPDAFGNHDEILARLYDICTEQVILSARLDIGRLPKALSEKAERSGEKDRYSMKGFWECAEKYFDVTSAGYLGTYPLLVMQKKTLPNDRNRMAVR